MSDERRQIPLRGVPVQLPAETEYEESGPRYCSLRERTPREFGPDVGGHRLRLINLLGNKWVSGTTLRYYFFDRDTDGEFVLFTDGSREWRTWVGSEAQREVVRRGFEAWREVGIGLEFEEADAREVAEIRIGFMRGDGSWSALGRDILDIGPNSRTMNFGWDLTRPGELDTAIHEIGHTCGFPHEHQNPLAGIVWDEEAVYEALAQPPNRWDRNKTFYNIIRKLAESEVEGTVWDPDSVMHYPFGPGLIKQPEQYGRDGIQPSGGLSAKDRAWVKSLYPPVENQQDELQVGSSVLLNLSAGEQRSFLFRPNETRDYTFQTFGVSDAVLVLFERENGEFFYRAGDDDSGEDFNAKIEMRLVRGREYILRLRLYFSDRPGETAVMVW